MNERKHIIGLTGLIGLILNNIIGSGIFSSPTSIVQNSNSIGLSLSIWFFTGLISITGGLVYSEIATTININGGDNQYVNVIKWKGIALAFTLQIVIMVYPTVLCIQALTFSDYFVKACQFNFKDESAAYWTNVGVAVAIIIIILIMNLWINAAYFIKFLTFVAALKVILLLAVVVLACVKGNPSNLSRPFENSTLNPDLIVGSFYNAWFAFDGYDIAAIVVEEVKDPQTVLPKAVSISMSTVIILYLLINFAYAMVLGVDGILEADNIVETFAQVTLNKLSFLIPIVACVCLFGAMICTVLAAGRITHAMGRAKVLPNFLSCWHQTKNIPRPSLILHVLLALICILVANIDQLNDLNTVEYVAQWIQKALSALILLFIRIDRLVVNQNVFRINILFPCLYLVCLVSMALSTVLNQWTTVIFTLVSTAIGLCIYWLFLCKKGMRRSWLFKSALKNVDGVFIKICEKLLRCEAEGKKTKRGEKERPENLLVNNAQSKRQ